MSTTPEVTEVTETPAVSEPAPVRSAAPLGLPGGPLVLAAANAVTVAGSALWAVSGPAGLVTATAGLAAAAVGAGAVKRRAKSGGAVKSLLGSSRSSARRTTPKALGAGKAGKGLAGLAKAGRSGSGRKGGAGLGKKAAGKAAALGRGLARKAATAKTKGPKLGGKTSGAGRARKSAGGGLAGLLPRPSRGGRAAAGRGRGLGAVAGSRKGAQAKAAKAGAKRASRWARLSRRAGRGAGWLFASAAKALGGRRRTTPLPANKGKREPGREVRPAGPATSSVVAAAVPVAKPAPLGSFTSVSPGHTTTTERVSTMSTGFPLADAAAQMVEAANRYEPEDMFTYGRHLALLPEVFEQVAKALQVTAQKTEHLPVNPLITEQISCTVAVQRRVSETLAEIGTSFKRLHEADLARQEAPRTNEQMWNVR